MSYKPRSLFRLIEEMNVGLFLPHIQRPFVWEELQMRRLFDSLMRNYPIQTFLFWRTKDAIKARGFMTCLEFEPDLSDYYDKSKSDQGVEKCFVLDGQQRLQTLYVLFAGTMKAADEKTELEAYIDVTGGHTIDEEGLLHDLRFSSLSPGPSYFRIRDLLGKHSQRTAEDIADQLNELLDRTLEESDEARRNRHRLVRRNLSQLMSLLREDKHFWIQELDGVADEYVYRKILDIFVRVNSGGTKLDSADLMFAAMKQAWDEIEERVEDIVELLNDSRLGFDKAFVLKCLVVAHGRGAELGPEKFASPTGEELLRAIGDKWQGAEEAFQQLRDFIAHDLQLYSEKVIRTYSSFVPLFDYLYHNRKPDERNRVLMRAYYYKSQLFNWYRARTDTLINVMHGIVGKQVAAFPLQAIKDYFGLAANVELTIGQLGDTRLRFMILNLIYSENIGGSAFNVKYRGNEPHVDHIYPQSLLKKALGLAPAEINHLGNYRFVGATDNIRKRAEEPASYFGRLKNAGIDIEKHLLLADVATEPALLKLEEASYRDFRDRRLDRIYEVAKGVVDAETRL